MEALFSRPSRTVQRPAGSPAPPPLPSSPRPRPLLLPFPGLVLALVKIVGAAANTVCEAIDKALELELTERQSLEDLRGAVEDLTSHTTAYKDLMETIDTGSDAFTHFIQRYAMSRRLTSSSYKTSALQIPQTGWKGCG